MSDLGPRTSDIEALLNLDGTLTDREVEQLMRAYWAFRFPIEKAKRRAYESIEGHAQEAQIDKAWELIKETDLCDIPAFYWAVVALICELSISPKDFELLTQPWAIVMGYANVEEAA